MADRLSGGHLRPFRNRSWIVHEPSLTLYALHAPAVACSMPIDFEISHTDVDTLGDRFNVFSIKAHTVVMNPVGAVAVDETGLIHSDEGGALEMISTLILE